MELDTVLWRELRREQDDVVSHRQALDAGWSRRAIEHRVGRDWVRLLRGVYVVATGTPTVRQRRRAALLLAGPGAALTARTGLEVHGVLDDEPGLDVHVAMPEARRVVPDDFLVGGGSVVLHRTTGHSSRAPPVFRRCPSPGASRTPAWGCRP